LRLFCFHHAGSGGLAFNAWHKALIPSAEVIAVEVANRARFAMPRQPVGASVWQL
jgi:surfactin synthase thioesterase subunit